MPELAALLDKAANRIATKCAARRSPESKK